MFNNITNTDNMNSLGSFFASLSSSFNIHFIILPNFNNNNGNKIEIRYHLHVQLEMMIEQ